MEPRVPGGTNNTKNNTSRTSNDGIPTVNMHPSNSSNPLLYQSSDFWSLYVCPTTGGTYEFFVSPDETVDNFKRTVGKKLKLSKDRINLLYKERQLKEGKLSEYGVCGDSKITLLPNVESGLLSQKSDSSVTQALENLSDNQVNDFLTGKSPLTLAMRLGDHMMFVQLQLSTSSPHTSSRAMSSSGHSSSRSRSHTATTSQSSTLPSSRTPLHPTPLYPPQHPHHMAGMAAPSLRTPLPPAPYLSSTAGQTSPMPASPSGGSFSRVCQSAPVSKQGVALPVRPLPVVQNPLPVVQNPLPGVQNPLPGVQIPLPGVELHKSSDSSFRGNPDAAVTHISAASHAPRLSSSSEHQSGVSDRNTLSEASRDLSQRLKELSHPGPSTPHNYIPPHPSTAPHTPVSSLPYHIPIPSTSRCPLPSTSKCPMPSTSAGAGVASTSTGTCPTPRTSQSRSGSSSSRSSSHRARDASAGAVIESMHHHGQGVYSGTFSGTLNPTLQEIDGRPKRSVNTIVHILNDLLGASPQYRHVAQAGFRRPPEVLQAVTGQRVASAVPSSRLHLHRPHSPQHKNNKKTIGERIRLSQENRATRGKMAAIRAQLEERRQRRRMRRERGSSGVPAAAASICGLFKRTTASEPEEEEEQQPMEVDNVPEKYHQYTQIPNMVA